MAGCGCQTACGCVIVGDGSTAEVAEGPAGKFIVSSIQAIMAVESTDCIALEIDPQKILRATPILSDEPGSIALECTPDGLAAEIVVDPSSTAIVTTGPDGLRVDVPPAPAGDGDGQPGDLILHFGVGDRAGAIDADGDEVPRAGYADLWDALSLYADTAVRIVGDPTINGIPSTRFIAPGMPCEAFGFPFGTTVVSVDSSTAITLSAPADNSGSDTEVRVYPHGNGDGVSTFNTPDGNDVFPLGYDYATGFNVLGALGGADSVVIGPGSLPLHDHGASAMVTDPGHTHGATSTDSGHSHGGATGAAGSHFHGAGTGGGADFVTIDQPVTGGDFIAVPTVTGTPGVVTQAVSIPTQPDSDPGIIDFAQGNRAATSTIGTHTHTIPTGNAAIGTSIAPAGTSISVAVDVADAGSATPDPVSTVPRHNVVRWMVRT